MEVLKAGGLRLDSGTAGIRETMTITVLVEATDGYRAVFALAELDAVLAVGIPQAGSRAARRGLLSLAVASALANGPLKALSGRRRPMEGLSSSAARWVRRVRAVTVRKN